MGKQLTSNLTNLRFFFRKSACLYERCYSLCVFVWKMTNTVFIDVTCDSYPTVLFVHAGRVSVGSFQKQEERKPFRKSGIVFCVFDKYIYMHFVVMFNQWFYEFGGFSFFLFLGMEHLNLSDFVCRSSICLMWNRRDI